MAERAFTVHEPHPGNTPPCKYSEGLELGSRLLRAGHYSKAVEKYCRLLHDAWPDAGAGDTVGVSAGDTDGEPEAVLDCKARRRFRLSARARA